jgi:hypothetical protein
MTGVLRTTCRPKADTFLTIGLEVLQLTVVRDDGLAERISPGADHAANGQLVGIGVKCGMADPGRPGGNVVGVPPDAGIGMGRVVR